MYSNIAGWYAGVLPSAVWVYGGGCRDTAVSTVPAMCVTTVYYFTGDERKRTREVTLEGIYSTRVDIYSTRVDICSTCVDTCSYRARA